MSLHAAQRIIAISENVAGEIHAESDFPHDDMTVVPHGVEAASFATERKTTSHRLAAGVAPTVPF